MLEKCDWRVRSPSHHRIHHKCLLLSEHRGLCVGGIFGLNGKQLSVRTPDNC